MSVNVTLTLDIDGLADDPTAEAVEAALHQVFVAESVDGDVVLERVPGSLAGRTPYPLIISGFYRWHDGFEARVRAAVSTAAPAATVTLTWGHPDEP